MTDRDLFPRNLGDPSKRSSRRKRNDGWPSGLDLNERTSEGTIAYSWRGEYDRRYVCASKTANAQNSGGVNELGHVRSRPGPPRLYSLYRGLVFPMGPRLISWLCESNATRPRVNNAECDGFLERFFQDFSISYDYIRRRDIPSHAWLSRSIRRIFVMRDIISIIINYRVNYWVSYAKMY